MLRTILSNITFNVENIKLSDSESVAQSVCFKHVPSGAEYLIKVSKRDSDDGLQPFAYLLQENGHAVTRTTSMGYFLLCVKGLKPPKYPVLNTLVHNELLTRSRLEQSHYHNVYKASIKGDIYKRNHFPVHIFESRHSTLWEVYVDFKLLDAGSYKEGLLYTLTNDNFKKALQARCKNKEAL